ncbi:MAG TPA: outer membrane protein transport protein [Vicinamibacteria bacterium]|nr:outer membrane protein transport protein [Vicinamibacteria bacterium]
MASSATGQTPSPPPQITQDELDLQSRANVVQGSGARALGMGGAFLARADDATAASWNPAGLSYLRLPEVSFVYTGGRLDSLEVTPTSRKEDQREGRTPDFFAAAYPFDLGRVSGSAQVSFQRIISFQGDRTIEETFVDGTTVPTTVTSEGGYDVVTLGTGVAVRSNLRVGFTINRWFNGYHQTLDRDTVRGGTPGHTTQEFDYDFSGWNVNLGLVWSPHADLNLGLVYKSAFTADVQLNKTRTDLTVPPSTNQANSLQNPITLDFPAAIGLGASWRPRSRLTISADYTRTAWSEGEIHNYFTLPAAARRPLMRASPIRRSKQTRRAPSTTPCRFEAGRSSCSSSDA